MSFAQIAALVLLAALVGLQIALAAGAPLGAVAWGGQHRVLPPKQRAGSAIAAIVLVVAIYVLVAPVMAGLWIFGGYFTLNTLGNLASKSRLERLAMTPVAAMLAICFILTAWRLS